MRMQRHAFIFCLLAGCGSPAQWVPLSSDAPREPEATLVWVGRGECERYEEGRWARAPEFDYEFSVEQSRYADRWESVKTMRRLHPDYDGSAGERLQTYFFHMDYAAPDEEGRVRSRITSSLGAGEGTTDCEFRSAVLEIRADVSSYAPFDTYRITQSYRYEEGRLSETVELNEGESPWVRNREEAALFARHTFAEPPTRR
jgi:hypothetical protein